MHSNSSAKRLKRQGTGYVDRVLEFARTREPGTVTVVRVEHDPDCPRLVNGPCRCAPDIVAVAPIGRST